MIHLEYPETSRGRPRLGVDACPGIDERGHGLSMRTLHDATCCAEWAAGETPWPQRADEWRKIAERWGSTWPRPAQQQRLTSPVGSDQAEQGKAPADPVSAPGLADTSFPTHVQTGLIAASSGPAPSPAQQHSSGQGRRR